VVGMFFQDFREGSRRRVELEASHLADAEVFLRDARGVVVGGGRCEEQQRDADEEFHADE